MQQRRVRLGDILDDYCPRERRITNHAVVAMIDDDVKQTRCTTCDAEHEYKQAKVPAPRRKKAAGALVSGSPDAVSAGPLAVQAFVPPDPPVIEESFDLPAEPFADPPDASEAGRAASRTQGTRLHDSSERAIRSQRQSSPRQSSWPWPGFGADTFQSVPFRRAVASLRVGAWAGRGPSLGSRFPSRQSTACGTARGRPIRRARARTELRPRTRKTRTLV